MSGEYGEARQWTGDDDRDFGPAAEEAPCQHCGARADEDCTDTCQCDACEYRKAEIRRGQRE